MFEIDPAIGLAGTAKSARLDAASNARIADHFESAYEEWRALAKRLQQENAELRETAAQWKRAHDVLAASKEASTKLVQEWRGTHPDSPLLAPVGKLQDGSPLSRGLQGWIAAFDAAARRLGIANPAAHRIS